MWLFNSSIGRKVVMSVTGISLILFMTFHGCMNVVALFSAKGYNMICEFLGANWYAVVATLALAALAVIHIVYAFILTIQNRKARGDNHYNVTEKPAKVEWASQNMLVLGIIILLGLLLHLYNFWCKMMFTELAGIGNEKLAADGFYWIQKTFKDPVYVGLYIIWIVALWFHLTHGFWSSIQTLGWSGHIWFKRWKVIGIIFVTLLCLMFIAVVLGFYFNCAPSLCGCNGCTCSAECCIDGVCTCNLGDLCECSKKCVEAAGACCGK